jgi:starvation-inducible DNA-binding protein
MHRTKIDLPEKHRTQLVALLNQRLADLIDLQLQAKQAHWNVRGPHFMALHELFDGVHAAVLPHVDGVAERIGNLGGMAEGTLQCVLKQSSLAEYPANLVAGPDHIDRLSSALAQVGQAVRAAIDQAAELGDQDTADLFTGISRDLDQQLWFVEAHQQSDR